MNHLTYKSDTFGIVASTLCLIHCIATPFIFIAQSCSAMCCENAPNWWSWIDYFFLFISFIAVYRSTQNTSRKIMKPILWMTWAALFTVVVNEKLQWLDISKNCTYFVAMLMILLHLYNLKFCQCNKNKCCTHNGK